jgi:hypothetical protein
MIVNTTWIVEAFDAHKLLVHKPSMHKNLKLNNKKGVKNYKP